jgi:hypothetical protein
MYEVHFLSLNFIKSFVVLKLLKTLELCILPSTAKSTRSLGISFFFLLGGAQVEMDTRKQGTGANRARNPLARLSNSLEDDNIIGK